MPEKLTLAAYLDQRGVKAKALKRGEAEAFGIPYPLQSGWPSRYGSMEITLTMIEDARVRIRTAKQESGDKAKRVKIEAKKARSMPPAVVAPTAAPLIRGFVLRQARRYRSRVSVP